MKNARDKPQIVLRDGKPAVVIIDIDHYEDILERLEDLSDLKTLQAMRKKPLRFKTLDEFLSE
ncbi:MAG: type II toxin-antitoxin system prevent-host-death family antitoxin [Phycisphaerae bacterium]